MEACTNPEILKVIYFFLLIVDIVKIVIPIILIILGIIDFSKSVVISDEKVQKKSLNLFLKRLLYGILVFAVPWIVEVVAIALGNVLGDKDTVNFTDCLENANAETIEKLENGTYREKQCYQCNADISLLKWSDTMPSNSLCPSGWHSRTDLNENNCK